MFRNTSYPKEYCSMYTTINGDDDGDDIDI